MKAIKIGIIAEDTGDVDVLKILAAKLTKRRFSTSHFVGKGCGPLRKKIPGWCKAFSDKGIEAVVIVHDLDRNKEKELRELLENMLPEEGFTCMTVVIPTEELEAWLLSDEVAIKTALKLHTAIKPMHHPEKIVSPKEHLGKLVRRHSKNQLRQYVNTVDNMLIAKQLVIEKLKKCTSFKDFKSFVNAAIG